MKDGSPSTAVGPPQYLLSTIYRQSWHPVASTQRHSQRRNTVNRIGSQPIAPPFQSTVSPRKRSSSLNENYKSHTTRSTSYELKSRNGVREYKASQRHAQAAPVAPTAPTAPTAPAAPPQPSHRGEQKYLQSSDTNTAEAECLSNLCSESKTGLENLKLQNTLSLSLGTKQVQTPLSVWRRRLKTYVANSRGPSRADDISGTSLTASAPNIPLHFAARQHSWSNLSSAKAYRIINYPNNTLARICLEGKSPPMQIRPDSTVPTERLRTYSNSTWKEFETTDSNSHDEESFEVADGPDNNVRHDCLPKTNENESTEGDDSKKVAEQPDMVLGSENSTPQDIPMHDSNSNDSNTHSNTEEDDDYFFDADCDQQPECSNLWRYDKDENGNGRSLSEVLDVSDLSENECYSDRDDEESDLEQTENDMERFKKMYEHENRSTTTSERGLSTQLVLMSNRNEASEKIATEDYEPDGSDVGKDEDLPDYAFAEVLPGEFSDFNLRELSFLPPDINWRSVVDVSRSNTNVKLRLQNRQQQAYPCSQRQKRKSRTSENQGALESIVDRMLALEKLQSLTVQQEVQRRYHNAHHRHGFVRSKSVSGKATPAATAHDPTPEATETAPNAPVEPPASRSNARRRNSNPNVSMRMAWATETTQGDSSVFKRACKDGDLTILHKHWLASCRSNSRRSNATRRNSENTGNADNPRNRQFRQRPGLSMYVYEWSERCKDDKNRNSPFPLSHPRPCPACRERARKLRRDSVNANSQPASRPRTPRPCSRSNSRCATNEKSTTPFLKSPSGSYSTINRPTALSTNVVSPLLWKQCKPTSSNLHLAKTTIKSAGKDYEYLTRSFQRSARNKSLRTSDTQLLSSAVTISSVLYNGSVN